MRIVNTSDASLVDEMALADALNQGQVQAAALDVYNTEPFHRANSTSARLQLRSSINVMDTVRQRITEKTCPRGSKCERNKRIMSRTGR